MPDSEDEKVEPTPFQRNDRDVAVELTKLYYSTVGFKNADEIANTYLKFYATAAGASESDAAYLSDFMTKEFEEVYLGE